MNVEFKFDIGDSVRHKGSPTGRAMLIIERLTQECHGGTQIIYRLRDGFGIGSRHELPYTEITEPELIPDRPTCEGCMYGIPVIAAPGMATGFAHVENNRRQVCEFGRTS